MKKLICFFVFLLFSFSIFAQTSKNNPLDDLIVLEAEEFQPDQETKIFLNKNPEASNNFFITPVPGPYRMYSELPQPVVVTKTIEIPVSGRWFIHVRYSLTPENIRKILSSSKPPKHFRMFQPFKVVAGNQEFVCGANQEPGQDFRWDSFSINLSSGSILLKIIMSDLCGPDCIVFSRIPDYKPQISDYHGPLWFRFKVLDGPDTSFYLLCRLHFNPYEVKRPVDIGWLFKDKVATTIEESNETQKDASNFLTKNQWSPWIKTANPKRAYCTMHVMVMPSNPRLFPDARRSGLNNIEIAFQAATRPDEQFLIHQYIEKTGPARGLYILMPHESGLAGMKKWTKSYTEWAEERLTLVKQTGAKPDQGPKKIQVFTDARATVYRDIDAIIESCKLAGFNGFSLDQSLIDETTLWIKIKDAGFFWNVAHHLMININLDWDTVLKNSSEKNIQSVLEQQWYEKIKERVLRLWGSRPEIRRKTLDLAILADEPNPQPHYLLINYNPVLKTCFHEFLKENGLKPEFFGKKNWDEVEAIGYMRSPSNSIEQALKNFGIQVEWKNTTLPQQDDEELLRATQVEQEQEKKEELKKDENLKKVQVPLYTGIVKATKEEKRLYYWTQRFRSFYTRRIYGQGTKVVKDLAETGFFKKDIKISPNFQAAPMMETRMWDGALNLFEWARNNTTNFLLLEDWINDPYRVGFGFTLLNAAARKNNQELGYLIVVDRNFRRRYLTGLATGVKLFIDYSYGPTITKGPAWASSPEYVKDWCEMLRWTARCEDDILKTRLRPADVAILIANSSEINSVYFSATHCETSLAGRAFGARPLFRRAGIYTALLDSNIPVEIVSEEEILEENILDRYKVLYVADTHVSSKVQEKIKEWVKKGGVLCADYVALARNEYDEDSDIMNDVFGLSSRGDLPEQSKSIGITATTIKLSGFENLEPVSFTGSLYKPEWKLSTGKAIAVFEDGSPAVVYNRYGKGQAVLIGCSGLVFSPYSIQATTHPEFDKVRKVVSFAAEISGAKRHCQIDVPGINSFVRDGEKQTIVFLINSTGRRQQVKVNLKTDRKVISAFDAKGEKIDFVQNGNEVVFSRVLNENDGDICIFRY